MLWRYREQGLRIATVSSPPDPSEGGALRGSPEHYAASAAATLDPMRSGCDIVYQEALFDGRWRGRTDFLRRVERPCPALGDFS